MFDFCLQYSSCSMLFFVLSLSVLAVFFIVFLYLVIIYFPPVLFSISFLFFFFLLRAWALDCWLCHGFSHAETDGRWLKKSPGTWKVSDLDIIVDPVLSTPTASLQSPDHRYTHMASSSLSDTLSCESAGSHLGVRGNEPLSGITNKPRNRF